MSSNYLNKVNTGWHSGMRRWYDHQRETRNGGARSRYTNKDGLNGPTTNNCIPFNRSVSDGEEETLVRQM